MGGGDLNTKKSWHPNTLKNQERVWRAEQAAEAERRRIADLRAEMTGERAREELQALATSASATTAATQSDRRLGWMYTQPNKSSNSEDYLLGKEIDKNYERSLAEDRSKQKNHVEHEVIPFSIRSFRSGGGAAGSSGAADGEQVDLVRKLQEDPLAAIRRRELDARAQLLQNPLRLQKLASLLRDDQEKRKEKKAKKKSKKYKSDLDQLLTEKLNKLQSKSINLASLLSPDKKKKKKKKRHNKSESDNEPSPKMMKRKQRNGSGGGRGRSRDSSGSRHRSRSRDRSGGGRGWSRDRSGCRGKGSSENRSSPEEKPKEVRERSDNPEAPSTSRSSRHYSRPQREARQREESQNETLSERCMEARRAEMMCAAAVREKERERELARHREATQREDRASATATFDEQFATRQAARAAGRSVADRLRANVYNIQRSHAHMDTHFARR